MTNDHRARIRDNRVDWVLVFLYLFIVFFGWMNIYSASQDDEIRSIFDLGTNYGRQMIWIGLSLFAAFGIMFFDSKFFPAFAWIIYGTALVLLALVLVAGQEVSGSKSWFKITETIKFQPSEFGKFATALALAKIMGDKAFSFSAKAGNAIRIRFFVTTIRISREAFWAFITFTIPAVLILAEKDTGSTIAFASLILVFYREGMTGIILLIGVILAILFLLCVVISPFILMGVVGVLGLLLAGFFWLRKAKGPAILAILILIGCNGFVYGSSYILNNILLPHQKIRVEVLMGVKKDLKGAGYNVHQSKIAIGSGGAIGKGFLQGTQTRYKFVPKQYTDFIFSVIGEEWGFLGSALMVLVFVALLSRLVLNAEKQRSRFSRVYGYCVASILFAHFALNVGMALGLAPTIGIPLPMVSYGGSSLFSFTVLLFVFIKLDSNRSAILS